ncbi:MAG: cupin domain-containing protein [Lachnospiraceae bacterium]|nr:cupin domain-containing protein [Lachnospiraceae bacterium]
MVNDRWVFYDDVKPEDQGGGVIRRVLAYSPDVMAVENTFSEGAVGALHSHPHTQITYVVKGVFEFEIDGEKHVVRAGDTLLKTDGVEHGCVCREAGVLLDIFAPARETFVKDI